MKLNNNIYRKFNSPIWSSNISLVLIITTFISCDTTKCPEKDLIHYYNFTEEEKSKIPYTGNDTLYFLDENKNEIVLIGRGKKVSYYDISGIILDCNTGNVDRHEINQYNFDSSNNSIFVELKEEYNIFNIKVNGLSSQAYIREISNSSSKTYRLEYQIDSFTYKNVNILNGIEDRNQKIILNKDVGIIQIKFSDTHYWLYMKH